MMKDLQEAATPVEGSTPFKSREDKNLFYWSSQWRQTIKRIKERDNYECQHCKAIGKVTMNHLIVHHIYPLEYHPELRLLEDNLLTVCIDCHNTIHSTLIDKQWNDEWW